MSISSLVALIIGCGGSGGSGSSHATSATLKAGIKATALESYQSLAGGMSFPNKFLRLTAPSGSGIGSSPTLPSTRTARLIYNSTLGLYENDNIGSSTITSTFYTDSAGTQLVGTLTATSSSGSFNFTAYPVTITASGSITGGKLPLSGTCKIVYQGPKGNNSMTGSFSLPTNKESATINMSLSDTHAVGGSVTIVDGSTTISATNIQGQLDGVLSCSAAVQPGNFTGTGTLNFDTMQISLKLTSSAGVATASINSSGNLVITYPDGSTETVTDPISALIPGNSTTGGTTSGSTSSTAGSTSTTSGSSTPVYGTPVEINVPSGDESVIFGHSSDSRLAGTVASVNGSVFGEPTTNAAYWASPTATATVLPTYPGQTSSTAYSVNSHGVIVGSYLDSNSDTHAIVWSSPTAKPTILPGPSGISFSQANSINDSGAIVGYTSTTSSVQTLLYWASPTATSYTTLKGAPNNVTPVKIQNSGKILASAPYYGSGIGALWSSYTSTSPTLLNKIVSGGDAAVQTDINNSGLVVGYTTYQQGPTIWSPSGYAPARPMVPSGFYYGPISQLEAVNDAGAFVGQVEDKTSNVNSYLWMPGQDPVSFATLLPAINGTNFEGILNDYSLIVQLSIDGDQSSSAFYVPVKTAPKLLRANP